MNIDVKKILGRAQTIECKAGVPDGNIVCISGPSGSGKSTLLHVLAGLTVPSSGRIEWKNEPWFDSSLKIHVPPAKRGVSLVFQEYALFPNMTVEKNIRFGLRNRESDETNKWIGILGLEDIRHRKPEQLSGGQQQRTALARSIVADTGIILLDEPFSAIDPVLRKEIMSKIFSHFREVSSTVFVVSHEVDELKQYCDQMFRMKDGVLEEARNERSNHTGRVLEIFEDKLIVEIDGARIELPRNLYPNSVQGASVEIIIS